MSTFEIKDDFYLNGKPFKIISGAFHYFRTVPEYWEDRMLKVKALGLNTVETYIPWNLHEPKPGTYCFDGMLDIERFIKIAEKLGLYVIVRPSPYICAEWEFGGLPGWLLKEDGMRLRVSEGPFLKAFEAYYNVLIPKLVPHQIDKGGNIILMQVENEYGYFANDRAYMESLAKIMRGLGVTVPFITSDNPETENLRGGSIDGALPTGNFGSRTEERFG
ncbi:MAG: beta-galactosidase, partial [Lachnospiraceae bacterium]|nr:beta-galactosidase [Lachnospiraceae bacterium]